MGDVLGNLEWGAVTRTCRTCGKTWKAEGLVSAVKGPRYSVCPECEAADAAQKKAEAERLQRLVKKARWEALCPPDFRKHDPARLPANAPLAKVLAWQYGPRGLLAIGPTGAGKTRCMFLLVKRLLEEGRTIQAFDCWSFGYECIRRFRDGTGTDWAEAVAAAEVCFFDDFGKEPLTNRVEHTLSGVIDFRVKNELPILITSNLTGEALMNKASQDRGAPMVRRLREFCKVIVFEGKGA